MHIFLEKCKREILVFYSDTTSITIYVIRDDILFKKFNRDFIKLLSSFFYAFFNKYLSLSFFLKYFVTLTPFISFDGWYSFQFNVKYLHYYDAFKIRFFATIDFSALKAEVYRYLENHRVFKGLGG